MDTKRYYVVYHNKKIEVTVENTFKGGTGLMANVVAIDGYPFYSNDVQSQGETSGSWMCNGYRVRADLVCIEPVETVETLTAVTYGNFDLLGGNEFGSKAWWDNIDPIPF